jgi:HEAT repeat protein
MDKAIFRAKTFVAVFFLAATAALLLSRRVSVADRLVSLDEAVRLEAAGDLRGLDGKDRARLVKPLLLSLEGKEPSERRYAAEALGLLGPLAGEAVPALAAALKADDDILGAYSAEALKRIGTPEALKALAARRAD